MHNVNKCSLCGGDNLVGLYTKTIDNDRPWSDFLRSKDLPSQLSALACKECGLIFQSPVYDDEELQLLYNLGSDPASQEAIAMAEVNSSRRAKDVYNAFTPWLDASKGSVLDVGGRSGELMRLFVKAGYEVSVLDMDGGDPVDARIEKIRKPFLDLHEYSFNAITMLHVLEHVVSPRQFLEHACGLLTPNGLLYIEVPSELLTPIVFRHIGDHRHIVYFSRETLRATLEIAGFTCLSCNW